MFDIDHLFWFTRTRELWVLTRKLWELCWSDFGHYESGLLPHHFARCYQPIWLKQQPLTVWFTQLLHFIAWCVSLPFDFFPFHWFIGFSCIPFTGWIGFSFVQKEFRSSRLQREPKHRKWERLEDLLWEHLQHLLQLWWRHTPSR